MSVRTQKSFSCELSSLGNNSYLFSVPAGLNKDVCLADALYCFLTTASSFRTAIPFNWNFFSWFGPSFSGSCLNLSQFSHTFPTTTGNTQTHTHTHTLHSHIYSHINSPIYTLTHIYSHIHISTHMLTLGLSLTHTYSPLL